MPFVLLKSTRAFFMILVENVSHPSSRQKKVGCLFALSLIAWLSAVRPGLP